MWWCRGQSIWQSWKFSAVRANKALLHPGISSQISPCCNHLEPLTLPVQHNILIFTVNLTTLNTLITWDHIDVDEEWGGGVIPRALYVWVRGSVWICTTCDCLCRAVFGYQCVYTCCVYVCLCCLAVYGVARPYGVLSGEHTTHLALLLALVLSPSVPPLSLSFWSHPPSLFLPLFFFSFCSIFLFLMSWRSVSSSFPSFYTPAPYLISIQKLSSLGICPITSVCLYVSVCTQVIRRVCDGAKCLLKHSSSHTFCLFGGKCYHPAATVLLNIHSAENRDEIQSLTNTTGLVNALRRAPERCLSIYAKARLGYWSQ